MENPLTIRTQKKGSLSSDSLQNALSYINLEVEAHCELNLPHRGAVLDIGNLPIVAAAAVNAVIRSVVGAECIDGVVEHVEEIRPELRTHPFADMEFLDYRKVGIETRRTMECIAAKVADGTASWKSERP